MIKLANMLEKDGNIVYTYGIEEAEKEAIDKEVFERSDIIICPTPLSKDGNTIFMPYIHKEITIQEVLSESRGKIFIAGNIPKKYIDIAKENDVNIIDIMESEDLVIYNTIATAEGTINIMIEDTDKILQGQKVLILGFGRVAKTLAMKLKGLQMEVTCVARKDKDIAWIETYGYRALYLSFIENELKNYDFIINTIPYQILKEEQLSKVKKETLLIDLASSPGGICQDDAKKLGLKSIWALALPGKIAPTSSAKFIRKVIYSKIL